MITINEPIWKNMSVGLADYKLIQGENRVQITYVDKNGERLYPGYFKIDGAKAKSYPIQIIKRSGVKVHLIPIADMEHVGGEPDLMDAIIGWIGKQ